MASRKLVIEVVGDASKLDKTFKQAATSTTKFGRALDGLNTGRNAQGLSQFSALTKGGAIAVGAGIAAQQLRVFTEAASDLNEQITKSQQVFGASAESVQEWSRTTAASIGISRTAALEAAGTFGNLFSTVGLQADQAAVMSRRLVQLAADLASFNNADPSDVLDALRSGLIGEAEPLRRFGVLLSEARVQQRAMSDTGKDTAKSLTAQEKALARYEIILGDTTKAQGDFARTADGFANQQRKLNAQLSDLQTSVGRIALPLMTELIQTMNQGIGVASRFGDALGNVGVHASDIGDIIKDSFVDFIPVVGLARRPLEAVDALFGGMRPKIQGATDAAEDFAKTLGGIGRTGLDSVVDDFDAIRSAVEKANEPFPDWLNNVAQLSAVDVGRTVIDFFSDAETKIGDATAAANEFAESLQGINDINLNPRELPTVQRPAEVGRPGRPLEPRQTPSFGQPGFRTTRPQQVPDTRRGTDVETRNRIFDSVTARALSRAENIADIDKQIKALQAVAAKIDARIAATKDVTRRLNLEDEQAAIFRDIKNLRKQKGQDLIDALQLNVDKAAATRSFGDDLAGLESLQAGIRQEISVQGNTLELRRRLLDVNDQIAAVEQQRGDAFLSGLQIGVDKAAATKTVADDLRTLTRLQAGIREQIKVQGETLDLTNRLRDVTEKISDARRDLTQQRQFRALGLSASGDEVTPGVKNLEKQLKSLSARIDERHLKLGSKLGGALAGARKVLSGELGKATEESRSRIQELFDTIRGEFDKQQSKGPLTKTKALNTKKVLAGLGLSPADERELRSRLSVFNSAGRALATPAAAGAAVSTRARPPVFAVHAPDVFLDGQKISTNTRRNNTVHGRRNPKQKRGTRF